MRKIWTFKFQDIVPCRKWHLNPSEKIRNFNLRRTSTRGLIKGGWRLYQTGIRDHDERKYKRHIFSLPTPTLSRPLTQTEKPHISTGGLVQTLGLREQGSLMSCWPFLVRKVNTNRITATWGLTRTIRKSQDTSLRRSGGSSTQTPL